MSDVAAGLPSTADSMSLADVREGRINVKMLASGRKAIVLRRGSEIKVFGEVCPHMGADMSEATYCPKDNTLRCKWHGYLFGVADGTVRENPNDRLLGPLRTPTTHYRPEKTPNYRLRSIPFRVEGGTVYIGREEET